MVKIENLINESIKDRLVEVTSKPERRVRKPIKGQMVASTDDHRRKVLGEIRALDQRAIERGEMQEKLVPVLFLWGEPRKILHSNEVQSWENLGIKITYLKESEVKTLKIKH